MRRITAPLGLALVASLGACGPVNRGLESVHQPLVSRADYAIDLGTAPKGLAPGEEQRLAGWFDTMRLGYGDAVAVDDPVPYGHRGAHDTVAAVAARYGLLVNNEAPVTQNPVAAGMIRVVVTRSSARTDRCPNWDAPSQPNFSESTSSNFGCAVNTNLAAMVASPTDLVRGHASSGPTDARVANKSVALWRDQDPTGKGGLKQESTKSGGGQ
ncbi:MAG: CpaD family pilus assembly protein [Sphingomonadaceae bacterium]|nr:CpaD family pilus assembly protein [Sphingomonadaceae bacterium]